MKKNVNESILLLFGSEDTNERINMFFFFSSLEKNIFFHFSQEPKRLKPIFSLPFAMNCFFGCKEKAQISVLLLYSDTDASFPY